ncbi:hypothetical protein PFICI_07875 [Pestalotiopsis fici W106-1]|uniref:Fe2OG dioxygenase domain-containing protein n=1 Tax=Pestalotiopsis fici (strain W106-1 / CGMCC3.15140) TaxID=1229662 RepID=W3X587_PESFW|nr:uncharacterized protein PFICI_07875 [Pestalotiopsis fici W106-1]ETS80346.1 hypothetical protein PFICI_07875 [Pestalotiopsis fici W106-1]
MATEVFPVIDVSCLDDFTPKSAEITRACQDWGFFILTGYGIPQATIDRMFALNQGFCALSPSEKSKFPIDQRQIGYDLKHSKSGAHESMVFGGVKGEVQDTHGLNTYWDAAKREEIETFKAQCHELSHKLLRTFAQEFGLPSTYFSEAHSDASNPPNVLRMLHYPKFETRPANDIPRIKAHTDWGSITFVFPRSGGLEVETPSGEWLEVPLVPGGVVVNIGDALHLWSGRALKSTLHRISFDRLPIDQDRWSIAYFVNANNDSRLEVLQKQADGTHAPQPGGIVLTAGEYYDARMYGSRLNDAERNWVSKATNLDYYEGLLKKVQQVGVADHSVVADKLVAV